MKVFNKDISFLFQIIAAVAVIFLITPSLVLTGTLTPSFTDFEEAGFVVGTSVHDHAPDGTSPVGISNINNCVQAWRVGNAGPSGQDEEVVDLGAEGKVWRLSQGTDTGILGNSPQSPNNGNVAPLTAGETGAFNDAGCGLPTTSNFYGQVDFRSATGGTQTGLSIQVSPQSGDRRHGFVRIVDDGAGLDIEFFETVGSDIDPNIFVSTLIDTNLSYTDWHRLGIEIHFVDGLASGTLGSSDAVGNDIVNIYVNGFLVHTGTSWETIYNSPVSVDRLAFARSGTTIIPDQLGGGLYFDNVLVTDLCPEGNCLLPPAFESVGDCISTLINENCSGLTGRDRAECNHDQQDFCFDLFGVKD